MPRKKTVKSAKSRSRSVKAPKTDYHKEVGRLALLIIALSIGIIIGVTVTTRNEKVLGTFVESGESFEYLQDISE